MATNETFRIDNTEPILSIGVDNKPIVLKKEDKDTMLLIRLILMEPGLNQLFPDMGVGLVSRFRFSRDIDMDSLSNTIKTQIEKYLPQFTLTDVRCKLGDDYANNKVIKIYIRSEELNAYLPINTETGQVIQSGNKLIDLK